MKPLIVGQAPGPNTDPAEPLSGASGRRLAALCELSVNDFLDRFERVNLMDRFPGKAGKGDAFRMDRARRAALRLSQRFEKRKVVLLGNRVARAFEVKPIWPAGNFVPMWGGFVTVVPHPSGISRWWNDPENARSMELFWKVLAAQAAPLARAS